MVNDSGKMCRDVAKNGKEAPVFAEFSFFFFLFFFNIVTIKAEVFLHFYQQNLFIYWLIR